MKTGSQLLEKAKLKQLHFLHLTWLQYMNTLTKTSLGLSNSFSTIDKCAVKFLIYFSHGIY